MARCIEGNLEGAWFVVWVEQHGYFASKHIVHAQPYTACAGALAAHRRSGVGSSIILPLFLFGFESLGNHALSSTARTFAQLRPETKEIGFLDWLRYSWTCRILRSAVC